MGLGLEVRRLWVKKVWGLLVTWVYGYGYMAISYMAIGNWLFASGYGYGYWVLGMGHWL